jgi:hypothetical protein
VALFALAGLGGVAVGLVRGGRPGRLLGLRLRWTPLIWACLAAQVLLGVTGDGPPPLLRDVALVSSYAGTGAWLAVNAASSRGGLRAGFLVVLAGWLLNVVPMALNDGMPVSTAAQAAIGAGERAIDEGSLWKHVPATSSTRAALLGDVIPVTPVHAVISAGDLALLAGMGGVVASALRGNP